MLFRPIQPSGLPIYLQLMDQVRLAVDTCLLAAGDQLPGIRRVAEELVINPNTVAKAYRELEHAGVVELRQGAGAFVTNGATDGAAGARALAHRALLAESIRHLRDAGLKDDEIRRLFEAALIWRGDLHG